MTARSEIFRFSGLIAMPPPAQVFDFVYQMLQINDHTVAHHVDGGLAQDAGGQQIQDKFAFFVDDGVAGVVSALIAHHNIVLFAEQVHHTALALVAPVYAGDRC